MLKGSLLTNLLTYSEEICLMEWDPIVRWHASPFIYCQEKNSETLLFSLLKFGRYQKILQFVKLFPVLYETWNLSTEIVIIYPTVQ